MKSDNTKNKSQKNQKFSFEGIDFEKLSKDMSSMGPNERDSILEYMLVSFPIEKYAETINNIFKIFDSSKSRKEFVEALKNYEKK